jgi:hypothetical protein
MVMVATPRVFVIAEHNNHQILKDRIKNSVAFWPPPLLRINQRAFANFQKILSFWKRPFVDRDAPKSRRPPSQGGLTCLDPYHALASA